jgi:hypothetical protein
MKKLFFFGVLIILLPALTACGDDSDAAQSVFLVEIFSNQPTDGDIAFDPVDNSLIITQGPSILFFGIDDHDPNSPEYRAFLDFPLDGSTGGEVVPGSAFIVSATLNVFVSEVSFASTVPTLIDLVAYPLSGLRPEDYDSPPLLTQSVDFFSADQGNFVSMDVTELVRKAQQLALTDLQLRFILDLEATSGFVSIDDQPNVTLTAPVLKVEYSF